jgi:pimeloyl-ACP methyl ester carboxylesterase
MDSRFSLPRLRLQTLTLLAIGIAFTQPKAPLGPPPGVLVDIGDHKMHIRCLGPIDGRPTVILEAGGGAFSKSWAPVQEILSPRVRTCAYDRAGLGWSEAGPAPRTMRQETFELHNLIERAKITGPFLLVGQSIGGLLVRSFTQQYGGDVAGVILVDSTHESSTLFNLGANKWMAIREQATGRLVPEPRLEGPRSTKYRPEDDYLAEEFQLLFLHRKDNPMPLGDRPLIVLAAGRRPPPPGMTEESYADLRRTKNEQARDLTGLSKNSKFVLDPASGHELHADNPQLVAKSIEEVIDAIARHPKLVP